MKAAEIGQVLINMMKDLPAGERLRCPVEGERDGKIILRVLDRNGESGINEAAGKILKSLGLVDDDFNRQLVFEMVRQEMPLVPEAFKKISAFMNSLKIPQELHEALQKLEQQTVQLNRRVPPDNELYVLTERLNRVIKSFIITGNDHSYVVSSKLKEVFSAQDDLLSLVKKLETLLAENEKPAYRELLNAARNTVVKLETLHNFNRAEPARDNMVIIYSAVRFEERAEPLRLFIKYNRESNNKNPDFSSCRVEVKLNTPVLGLVRCEVHFNGRYLTLQFITENRKACGILDEAGSKLVRRLGEMKYQVNMLNSRTAPESEQRSPFSGKEEITGLFQINLRV